MIILNNMRRQYIYNKVRGLLLASVLTPLVTIYFSSCSDFLEIEPQNEIVLEKFWSEKTDVDNIVAGCYSRLQGDDVLRRMMVWGEFRSDNISTGENTEKDGSLLNILKENIDAKNTYTTWDGFYDVINRCNTVIKYAPGVAAKDPSYTQSELQATLAEVSALRDLCYFYLIRAFRDVPYTTEAYTDDNQRMDLPATPFESVLDSLIADLESVRNDAVKRYPETKPHYQTGRITQTAIDAMLCEMYLWQQNYERCSYYADLVINAMKERSLERSASGSSYFSSSDNDNSRTNGYPLIREATAVSNHYGNAYNSIFGTGNSSESIFELDFDDDDPRNMPTNTAVSLFYGNAAVNKGYVAPPSYITDDVSTSAFKVYSKDNKKLDARAYENCDQTRGFITKFVVRSVSVNASSSTPTVSYGGKYAENQITSNWVIYRLTDVMLMKAEAMVQTMYEGSDASVVEHNQGIRQNAFSLVNAVNKRALCQTQITDTLKLSDYMTKSQLEELVLQERQRELMFEGKRWFDLVRRARREGKTDNLVSAALQKYSNNTAFIQNFLKKMDAIYWPYNYEEMKVNLNLRQNPAFGSGENKSYE